MKNLKVYFNDKTLVYEAIISNDLGLIKTHPKSLMKSFEEIVKSVIKGEYKIEYENFTIDTNKYQSIFERIEQLKKEFIIEFEIITPQKVLEYFYVDQIPYKKNIKQIPSFFGIELIADENLMYIGECIKEKNKYVIKYKPSTYEYRDYFTIAHELGHIFLHFSTNKKNHFIDGNEYKLKAARGNFNIEHHLEQLEQEANNFATYLLVPCYQLKKLINVDKITSLQELKNIFNVSKGTIYYAVKNCNLYNKIKDDITPNWANYYY